MILDTKPPLSVGFNVDPLNNASQFRGVGRYTAKLLEQLKKQDNINVVEFRGKNLPSGVDVVHYPYYDLFFLTLPFQKPRKTIVTVHDCIPLVFPDHYPTGIRGKVKFVIQKYSLRSASLVLTDSEVSKKDITHYLGVPEKKIKVIYLASDAQKQITNNKSQITNHKTPYFLYVGDVNFNKNLPRLIDAFILFNNKHAGKYRLIFVGKAFENNNLPETQELKIKANNNSQIVFAGYVDDSSLDEYYRNAFCYCQPSLYEGFGLQILEAMARGIPVITSNTSSCPEITGKAGILVNPNSITEISEAMNRVTEDADLRRKMIGDGLKQAGKFSWEKTAEETAAVYREVLDRNLSN